MSDMESVFDPTNIITHIVPVKWGEDPIFVFCHARSGSTVTRFALDAHPVLACGPETNSAPMCGNLVTFLSMIVGAPLSPNRGDTPPFIPDAAVEELRIAINRWLGIYLARRGKTRYAEKSLGAAQYAWLIKRIWPKAKFICLYRHPMDVIKSAIEASPWGFRGYGFENYIAASPGNIVHAMALFWMEQTSIIMAAEAMFPDDCYRLRYESLVADPEGETVRMFAFLGLEPVPGISESMFSAERERFGPSDYKIWQTKKVETDSVGRGWTLPVGMIGAQVRARIIQMCLELGYLPPDDNWGRANQPADMRVAVPAQAPAPAVEKPDSADGAGAGAVALAEAPAGVLPDPAFGAVLRDTLAAGVPSLREDFFVRWGTHTAETFDVVATPDGAGPVARWRVDLSARTVTAVESARPTAHSGGDNADENDDDGLDWDVIATAECWEEIISGGLNMSVAVRKNDVRYAQTSDAGLNAPDARVGMLGEILGLASWGQARENLITQQQSQDVPEADPS